MRCNRIVIACFISYSHMLLSCSNPQLGLSKTNLETIKEENTTQGNSIPQPYKEMELTKKETVQMETQGLFQGPTTENELDSNPEFIQKATNLIQQSSIDYPRFGSKGSTTSDHTTFMPTMLTTIDPIALPNVLSDSKSDSKTYSKIEQSGLPSFVLDKASIQPIEKVFPGAFNNPTGIYVKPKSIADLDCYAIEEFPEPEKNRNHFDDRPSDARIKFLIMHYTAGHFPSTINWFAYNASANRVSAHYVVTEEDKNKQISGGRVFQVVPEEKRAWHAGISYWRGIGNLNAYSIGIENVNLGFTEQAGENNKKCLTWYAFDVLQIASLGKLSQSIVSRYNIAPQNVVGHSDIAPGRKPDPGILFPWEQLYKEFGVGAWLEASEQDEQAISSQYQPKEPLPQGISASYLLSQLQLYGYDVKDPRALTGQDLAVIHAFQMHFSKNQRIKAYCSPVDREDMLWAWGLNAKYRLTK